MRKQNEGSRLDTLNAFSLDRLSNSTVLETGLSTTIGFDYQTKKGNKTHNLSMAQIFNEKENKKMSSKTSLDEKASDVVGTYNFKLSENINFDYNFNIDQNYKDFNYNNIVSSLNFNPIKLDFNYVLEDKHIGEKEFLKSKISYDKGDKTRLSFETKRNLISNSSEFYDVSYEYYNDCLRAGLVYRRNFIMIQNLVRKCIMFKITLVPFGSLDTPSVSK